MKTLSVLNPVANRINLSFELAARPKDLRSVTLGLVWNGKAGGDIALRRVAENLKQSLGYDINIIEFKDDFPFAESTIEKVSAVCGAVIGSTCD